MKHKRLVFFLVLIMLAPLGAQHVETVEKNEAERIECFTNCTKQYSQLQSKEHELRIKSAFFRSNEVILQSNSVAPIQLVRKIYILQLSLLI